MIYLDNASTVKPSETAINAIMKIMNDVWMNPSSTYYGGREAKKILENSREEIRKIFNAGNNDKIVFTSSGSASNNLAIGGFRYGKCGDDKFNSNHYILVMDSYAHSSSRKTVEENYKDECIIVQGNKEGFIDASDLTYDLDIIKENGMKPFVSIIGGNNEIGTVTNIKRVSEIVHEYNGILHVDATQLYPDRKIDMKKMGIDMLTFSGHKIGTPAGIGCLIIKDGINLSPLISGHQEYSLFSGTENVAMIYALAECAKDLEKHRKEWGSKTKEVRDYFLDKCLKEFDCELVGTPIKAWRLKNNASIMFHGHDAKNIQMYLDNYDIFCSVGSACNSTEYKPSDVLKAIGLKDPDIYSVVRFSFSHDNTKEEVDQVIDIIKEYMETEKDNISKHAKG